MVPMAVMLLHGAGGRLRGRVMGVRMLAIYGVPIGLLAAGSLIGRFGFAATASAYCVAGLLLTRRDRDPLAHGALAAGRSRQCPQGERNVKKKSSNGPASALIRSRCVPIFRNDRVSGVKAMTRFKALLIAAPVAAALLAAPAAYADEHGHGGGWHGGRGEWHGGEHHGPGVGGVLLGLGAAAVVGGVLASQAYAPPPPVYYAPPPAYYAPPPGYYAPPPAYYSAPPAYYPRGY